MKTRLPCLVFALIGLAACGGSKVEQPAASGLVITDLVVGSGAIARNHDTLTVQYVGRLTDSTLFASTRGRPFYFRLGAGEVIRGWDLGLPGMRVGGTRRLVIPPDLAYGEDGIPPIVPPNSTLVFDVTLVEVHSPVIVPGR